MNKANFKQKFNKEIKQLADKHNITTDKVVDIYFNQFNFLAKSIRNEENASLKLKGLGKFAFNHKLKDKLIELKQLKDEREILSKSSPKDGDGTQSD
jgi:nucleoid DNA-binding protein